MRIDFATMLESLGFSSITHSDEDVSKFLHNVKNKEHCVLIFQSEIIRDKIISEFFNSEFTNNTTTAIFTHNPSKFNCSKIIEYNELIENQKLVPNKINEFLVTVLDESYNKNYPKIVCEDTAWFSEIGLFKEHQESKIPEKILNESTIMCCYNSNKLNVEQLKTVLKTRNFIILEKPFSVYAKNIIQN